MPIIEIRPDSGGSERRQKFAGRISQSAGNLMVMLQRSGGNDLLPVIGDYSKKANKNAPSGTDKKVDYLQNMPGNQ